MFRSDDQWIWDFWFADDGSRYHLFYLHAPRSLGDPDLRHWSASIGHAVSADLRSWQPVGDALTPGPAGAFDDRATWTGSVVADGSGGWCMFYTGVSRAENALVQRIGLATSPDLTSWTKHGDSPVSEADPRWYERLADGQWPDEAWRDPWVFPDPAGDGWHMLITARANHGAPDQRGVIGHARSVDLIRWTTEPPLSAPGSGFGQLEVSQVHRLDDQYVLLFSCLGTELAAERRSAGQEGGIWAVAANTETGPFDITRSTPITGHELYSGRLIRDRDDRDVLLAFRHTGPDGFVGEITDPIPVTWRPDGMQLRDA